jgi:Zn-dependent protease with chaperone function
VSEVDERVRAVRGASVRMVVLYILGVAVTVVIVDLMVYAVASWMVTAYAGRTYDLDPTGSGGQSTVVVWLAVGVASLIVLLIIGLTSLLTIRSLNRDGAVGVAESVGAVPLDELPDTPALQRFRAVAGEVASACHVPEPRLYVMPDEAGINAFAAGSTPDDAVVAVTQGALELLRRDELRGVVAHEFGHIVNGDVRLNFRLIGVLSGVTVIGAGGLFMVDLGNAIRDDRGWLSLTGIGLFLVGGVLTVAGYAGLACGRLMQAAVGRRREQLADASAVQYTRDPAGLAGAFKKMAGVPGGARLQANRAQSVSHMLFGERMETARFFATHPPLADRIAPLDPTFHSAELDQLHARWRKNPPDGLAEDRALG